MAWRPANALVQLIKQFNVTYPLRATFDDGTKAGDEHHKQNPNSDHEVDVNGVVKALDITHDPAHGVDTYRIADYMVTHPDKRLRYIISNSRIAGDAVFVRNNYGGQHKAWTWFPYPGDNPHDHHMHFSIERDPALYDDQAPFDMGSTLAPVGPAPEVVPFALLKRGSTGTMVKALQTALHLNPDGHFGPATEQAVQAFQRLHGLSADGVVGRQTWKAIDALDGPPVAPPPPVIVVEPTSLDIAAITALAGSHPIARFDWPRRGRAPIGFIKGMALSFANALVQLRNNHPLTVAMARHASTEQSDALVWYHAQFEGLGMSNAFDGPVTLRHLFALLMGLGMRESSGKHCEGRDMLANNVTADTAEAGAWQMSWDARAKIPQLPQLMNEYTGDGFLSVYHEGVTCTPANLKNWGDGTGVEFQKMCKTKPDFAAQAAALGLRSVRTQWGPITRREVDLRREADDMLAKIQALI